MERECTIRSRVEGNFVLQFENVVRKEGLTPDVICLFQGLIYHFYQKYGRSLPWRTTHIPYHILVSEIMLQQTQTERVVEKYERFINFFPDFPSLAQAHLREVLRLWQGLGYNRRAISLKEIAQMVVRDFHGNLPSSPESLMSLPGIGRATACAICAFAFNEPVAFIETNIRRVFIHHFFQGKIGVKDAEILPLVEKTLDTSYPRKWYYALMDYGVMLKRYGNPNRKSAHYQKQPPFEGSNRQIRGMILRALTIEPPLSEREIFERLGKNLQRIRKNLVQLQKEGFVKKRGDRFTIA